MALAGQAETVRLRPMIASRLLVLLTSAALLASCASSPVSSSRLLASEDLASSSYGLFLAGHNALNSGQGKTAGAFLEQARADGDDSEGRISELAFTAALLQGDISQAAALAPNGPNATEAGKRMGRLVLAVEALAQDRPKVARPLLESETVGFPHKSAAALLAPWAAAMAGEVDNSLVRPQVRSDNVVDYFGLLGQAQLYERAKRYDEAETDYKTLTGGDYSAERMFLGYGGFLERRGRRADALALYGKGLTQYPRDNALVAAQARASAGRKAPPPPTVKEGAALAVMASSTTMINAKQDQLALAYLHLALRLDPALNGAWLMVGDVLTSAGETEAARLAYAKPPIGSPEFSGSRAKMAWSYQAAKNPEMALKLAREAASNGDMDAKITLADLLRTNDQFAESAEILTPLIAASPDWNLLFSRGIAYDRLGRWADGERDLQAALTQRPDDPEILNYLGYSWIDRGEHLDVALGMIQKALGVNPNSGAMVDSLGWAYYRLGDYKKAVESLERAVEMQAGEPDINDHLGDAYWRAGRRDEAGFQWHRVLTLEPDAKLKAAVEQKIAHGLDGPTPATRVATK